MKNGQKIQADYYAMAKKLARDVTFSGATQKNRPIIIPSPKIAREITKNVFLNSYVLYSF